MNRGKKWFIFALILFSIFGLLAINKINDINRNEKALILEINKIREEECSTNVEEEKVEYCEKLNAPYTRKSATEIYQEITSDFYRTYLSEFIIYLILILFSSLFITEYLKNRMIINDIVRENYKKIKMNLFFSAWRYSILVPLMLSIIMLLCYMSSNLTLFDSFDVINNSSMCFIDFLLHIFNAFLICLFTINICLIVARKEHNYLFCSLKSYLFLIMFSILLDSDLYNYLSKISSFVANSTWQFINLYNYFEQDSILPHFVFVSICLIISFIILNITYKNQEKLIIDSEKNDNREEGNI